MQAGALVRVFIASPGDVTPEREEACRVISDWNAAHSISRAVLIEPVRVETHARLVQGGHPQDIINGQLLKQCDILLAIFWHRLGTPTEKANSGTIQEIVEFSDLKGPDRVILMFCDRSLPNDVDIQQLEAVRKFRRQGSDKGLYKTFSDTAEFSRLFSQQLTMAMNALLSNEEAVNLLPERETKLVPLPEACTLAAAASLDQYGHVIVSGSNAGTRYQANGIVYSKGNDGRSEARWKAGFLQLVKQGFLENKQSGVIRLTSEGYTFADTLWQLLLLRRIADETAGSDKAADAVAMDALGFQDFNCKPEEITRICAELSEHGFIQKMDIVGDTPKVRLTPLGVQRVERNKEVVFAKSDNEDS